MFLLLDQLLALIAGRRSVVQTVRISEFMLDALSAQRLSVNCSPACIPDDIAVSNR